MQWTDDAIVLSARRHGEGSAVATLLTRRRGRHAGLARGASSARGRGALQPGNRVEATWTARLAEHLGAWRIELRASHAPELFDDRLRLAGLSAALAVAEAALPEREPHPGVYEALLALVAAMEAPELGDAWIAAHVRWELGLLAELGFGLDLARCAVTGSGGDLAFVSPRTGRAVSRAAAEPYAGRLLRLPGFLAGRGPGGREDLAAGLALTGHFLERHVFAPAHRPPPPARLRFADRLAAAEGGRA